MGLYINPPDIAKEEWLMSKGTPLPGAPTLHKEGTKFAVCLVNNGPFTAAGVCFSQRELEEFTSNDGRSKLWFSVEEKNLREVCGPDIDFYLQSAEEREVEGG